MPILKPCFVLMIYVEEKFSTFLNGVSRRVEGIVSIYGPRSRLRQP
jgi:hypothetical protein